MERAFKEAEIDFEKRVFTADGKVSDEMAKFASDAVSYTHLTLPTKA